jgi:hypothetical protein
MDFGAVAELGVIGGLVVGIIMLIDFIRKRFRESGKGERRLIPSVIECPNRIQGLSATLTSLDKQIGRLVDHHDEYPPNAVTEAVRGVARVEIGVTRLLEETHPGSRAQMIREESRDILKAMEVNQTQTTEILGEILEVTRRNGGRK